MGAFLDNLFILIQSIRNVTTLTILVLIIGCRPIAHNLNEVIFSAPKERLVEFKIANGQLLQVFELVSECALSLVDAHATHRFTELLAFEQGKFVIFLSSLRQILHRDV